MTVNMWDGSGWLSTPDRLAILESLRPDNVQGRQVSTSGWQGGRGGMHSASRLSHIVIVILVCCQVWADALGCFSRRCWQLPCLEIFLIGEGVPRDENSQQIMKSVGR